jgi:hypothetical protein
MRDKPNDHRTERCCVCRDYFTPREMSVVKPKHCIACACPRPKKTSADNQATLRRGLSLAGR